MDLTFNELPDIKLVKLPTITKTFTITQTQDIEYIVPPNKIIVPWCVKLDTPTATQTVVCNSLRCDDVEFQTVALAANASPIFFNLSSGTFGTATARFAYDFPVRRKIVVNCTSAVAAGDITLEIWAWVTDDILQRYQAAAEAT